MVKSGVCMIVVPLGCVHQAVAGTVVAVSALTASSTTVLYRYRAVGIIQAMRAISVLQCIFMAIVRYVWPSLSRQVSFDSSE